MNNVFRCFWRRRHMSNQVVGSRLAGALVLVSLFAACSPQPSSASPPASAPGDTGSPAAAVPTAAVTPTPAATAAAARGLPDFADLVAQVGPAVVNVQVVEKSPAAGQGSDSDSDD